ncbi:hypothetical protein BH10ACI1_BH10ACI1_00060 [soil metagenome]
MKNSKPFIFLLCGIVFGLAAFPVFAQKVEPKDIVINKRPLQDFSELLKEKIEKGEVDLDKSFKVVLEGVLTEDGKFDLQKSKFTLSEGDEQMVNVAKSGIQAIGDSGYFGYLRKLGAEKVKLTVAQDGETFSARIETEQNDENKAKTMASGLNTLLSGIKLISKQENNKISDDEMTIINGFQVPMTDGKNVILNFALPVKTFHEILLRNLNKSENNKQSGE